MAIHHIPLPELPEGWYWDTITLTPPAVPVITGEALPVTWVQRQRVDGAIRTTFVMGY
jgi:hypothetical protein